MGTYSEEGKRFFFPNGFWRYEAKGEASDEVEPPGVNIGPLEGETPEQHADRVYQELLEQHARSGGPTQRMKDAVALYKRVVVSSVGLHDKPSPFVPTKMGRVQDLTDEDLEGFDFSTDDKEG